MLFVDPLIYYKLETDNCLTFHHFPPFLFPLCAVAGASLPRLQRRKEELHNDEAAAIVEAHFFGKMVVTLQGSNVAHLGKRKIIDSKVIFDGIC